MPESPEQPQIGISTVPRGGDGSSSSSSSGAMFNAVPMDLPPRRIATFEVQSVISAGGMGTVYLAVQDRTAHKVALKVMNAHLMTERDQRRFEHEAEVLARLRHPGIAALYDAGIDASGVSYIAMEFVPNARPINDYVRTSGLGINDVLKLFIQVCDAVYHANQKGVIHRDLKPSNILVDLNGHPKIIDFGIARCAGSNLTERGKIVGTLQYMAPEQFELDSEDLDFRCDVYSLGVLLYELVCGTLPYDLKDATVAKAQQIIREAQPPRPSAVNRELRGRLEAVLLKSLHKQRELRYRSAADLMEDLRRYLNNETTLIARPPTLRELVRAMVRRHRAAVFAAAAIVAGLALGLGGAIYGWQSAAEHRRQTHEALLKLDASELEAKVNVAAAHARAGEFGLAEPIYLDVIAKRNETLGPGHPRTMRVTNNLLIMYLRQAGDLEEQGRASEAAALWKSTADQARELVATARTVKLEEPWHLGPFLNTLGTALTKVGQLDESDAARREHFAEAEAALLDAYRILMAAPREERHRAANSAAYLARLYEAWGRAAEAETWRLLANPSGNAS